MDFDCNIIANKCNRITEIVNKLEACMFPVLNRGVGKSLHHELNAVKVFPNVRLSRVDNVLDFKKAAESNLYVINGIRFDSPKVKLDRESAPINLNFGSERLTIYLPSELIDINNDEILCTALVETFLMNINEEMRSYNNAEYESLYSLLEIDDKIRRMKL